jgi:hypothetical protein
VRLDFGFEDAKRSWLGALLLCAALIGGCAVDDGARAPVEKPISPAEARALVSRLLPPKLPERAAWTTDIHAAFTALEIEPTPANICAAVAVTEQESSFRADPPVPGLAAIARKEIDRQRERAGIPRLVPARATASASRT